MKRKTHLATFCNISSYFSPNTGRIYVREENSVGKCLGRWSVPMTAERFEEIEQELADECNNATAIEWDANAAQRALVLAGAYPRPEVY